MIEAIAGALTLLSVYLAGRQNVWTWPTGIVSVVLFASVFWDARLYAAAGLQVGYVAQSIWGWVAWGRDEGKPRRLAASKWPSLICSCMVAQFPLYLVLMAAHSPSPMLDAITFVLSVAATWLLTYRYIESWYVWSVVNVLYAFLFATQGLYLTMTLSLVLLGINRMALLSWTRSLQSTAP